MNELKNIYKNMFEPFFDKYGQNIEIVFYHISWDRPSDDFYEDTTNFESKKDFEENFKQLEYCNFFPDLIIPKGNFYICIDTQKGQAHLAQKHANDVTELEYTNVCFDNKTLFKEIDKLIKMVDSKELEPFHFDDLL